jgi:hypothetical protein
VVHLDKAAWALIPHWIIFIMHIECLVQFEMSRSALTRDSHPEQTDEQTCRHLHHTTGTHLETFVIEIVTVLYAQLYVAHMFLDEEHTNFVTRNKALER